MKGASKIPNVKKMPFLVLKTDFEVEQGKILVSIQIWDIKKGYNSPGLFSTYSNTPIVFIIHFKTLSHGVFLEGR